MFSSAIFKQTLKANWKLWLIFTLIPAVMLVAITAVFDMDMITNMMDMLGDTPLAGMMGDAPTFLGMVSSSFYSLQGVILPMIFVIITANSLVATQVDRGSMAYLLSTPTKRSTVVRTQALYLVTALVAMFAVITLAGALSIHAFQGFDYVDVGEFFNLNIGLFLLMFATSGISFFFSCLFNLSKHSIAFGAGLPLTFFLLHMMAGIDANFENLRFLSLNTLFDTSAITTGEPVWLSFTILAAVGLVLYGFGSRIFCKKDLPL